MLTQEKLKQLFKYDEEGYLVNLVDRGRSAKAGDRAGRGKPTNYRQVRIDGKQLREHRLIWLLLKGEWPEVVDHIDHDIHNNKIDNLRSISHKANIRHGSGRQAGLYFDKKSNKWLAAIYIDCKKKHLGCFKTYEEALETRVKAEKEFWN